MAKYSIVTPNYNGFALMSNYFNSLTNQTYKDFEVIIVDDCSSDDSYAQLQDYASKSSLDIKLYQSGKNTGPGNARNIGMEHATGEYITFVDNDDWVEKNWLEIIDRVFDENPEIHCVIYDYYIKTNDSQSVAHSMYKGETGVRSLSECMIYARNHTIGKFYKLTDCTGIRFPLLRRCEDVAFVCRAIEACKTVYYLKKPLYYYYQRSTSLSNNKKMDESDMIKAFAILEDTLSKKYTVEMKEKSVSDLLYGVLLMMCKTGKSSKEIKDYIDRYEKQYPKWWKCDIVNHLGRAKKVFLIAAKGRQIMFLKILAWIHGRVIG